jgi:hypothetical protein
MLILLLLATMSISLVAISIAIAPAVAIAHHLRLDSLIFVVVVPSSIKVENPLFVKFTTPDLPTNGDERRQTAM